MHADVAAQPAGLRRPVRRGEWLVLCLQRLLQRAQPDTVLSEDFLPSLEAAMFHAGERGWFSLLSLAEDE